MRRALTILILLAVGLPVHGEEKGGQAAGDQSSAADTHAQPSPSTLIACKVDQSGTTIECHYPQPSTKSYFSRLLSPENLPDLLLFGVGIAGIFYAARTLGRVRVQTEEMKLQRIAMGDTLTTIKRQADLMEEQAGHMERQTSLLGKSISTAEKAAVAAEVGAVATKTSVEAAISKDRARLRVEITPLQLSPVYSDGEHRVWFMTSLAITRFGTTEARAIQAYGKILITDPSMADPDQETPAISTPSIIADTPFTVRPNLFNQPSGTIQMISNHQRFIHVYGTVFYYEIFSEDRRETSFYYIWRISRETPSDSSWEREHCEGYNVET